MDFELPKFEDIIDENEYLKERFAEKAQQIRNKIKDYESLGRPYSGRIAVMDTDAYAEWVAGKLRKDVMEEFGVESVLTISPDPANPRKIDQRKLDAYRKNAPCLELVDSVIAHENYHIKVTKEIETGKRKLSSAADLAQEEVEAYEKGLELLRNTLEKATKNCLWLCRCNQQRYESSAACVKNCPHARLGVCHAPTCVELDPKTQKWIPGKGRAF